MFPNLRRRPAWTVVILIAGMLLSMLSVGWLTWRQALLSESEVFQRQLAVRAQALIGLVITILVVTQYRMPNIGQMGTDLMRTPGMQRYFKA